MENPAQMRMLLVKVIKRQLCLLFISLSVPFFPPPVYIQKVLHTDCHLRFISHMVTCHVHMTKWSNAGLWFNCSPLLGFSQEGLSPSLLQQVVCSRVCVCVCVQACRWMNYCTVQSINITVNIISSSTWGLNWDTFQKFPFRFSSYSYVYVFFFLVQNRPTY